MILLLPLIAAAAVAEAPRTTDLDPWPDTIVLKNETVVRCRIIQATPESLAITYPRPGGPAGQTISRGLKWSEIQGADFSMDASFHQLLDADDPIKDTPKLMAQWMKVAPLVGCPRHPAGELGLALGRIALRHRDRDVHQRALDACRWISKADWNPERRHHARWGAAQLLKLLARPEEALAEARSLAADPAAEPTAAMPALVFVARENFAALRRLQDDNPRWMEDDQVRPERDDLLHRTLDASLKPSLFHGALETPASEGLWTAVEVLDFAGHQTSAADTARDLLKLYPGTKPAARARRFLDDRRLPVDPDAAPSREDPPPAAVPSSPPPAHAADSEPPVRRRPRYESPP